MSQIDVAGLAAQVVQRGHAEIDPHGVALDDGRQQRLPARPDQRADIDVPLADVAGDRRADGGVAECHFGLREVGLAHGDRGVGALVGGDGVVQVELACGILFVKRPDACQVAFGLECKGFVFLELGARLIHACAVELGVDDE